MASCSLLQRVHIGCVASTLPSLGFPSLFAARRQSTAAVQVEDQYLSSSRYASVDPSTGRRSQRPIFVAATRQHVGKTTVSLALMSGLQKRFDKVGFLKPVGQQVRIVLYHSILFPAIIYIQSISIHHLSRTPSCTLIACGGGRFVESQVACRQGCRFSPGTFSFESHRLSIHESCHYSLTIYKTIRRWRN